VDVTVARIGRAHGLAGEVRLDVRTDSPRRRLAPGTRLRTDPEAAGPLTVDRLREDRGAWFVRFTEVRDRDQAGALRGVALVAPAAGDEADAWYAHELAGLEAVLPDGTSVGRIEGLEHLPMQDLLVLREPTGERTLVPFVRAIVPEVDVPGGRVVVDPPGGLLARGGAEADTPPPDEA
jgi:16S rRNA processing protein RimM